MKISNYLLYAQKGNEQVLVKQLVTCAIIEIDLEASKLLQSGNFDNCDSQVLSTLQAQGFIVDASEDESVSFIQAYRKAWLDVDAFLLHIVPTFNCQLDCPYCYEDGIDRTKIITPQVQNCTVDWIDEYLSKNSLPILRLVWHGGEPLLCANKISEMMPLITNICESREVKLETQVVTNGVLMSDKVLDMLSRYNLQRLQVTLDGPPEIHDLRRIMKHSRKGSFEKIYGNILYALQNNYIDSIDLRINLDRQNRGKLEKLFERMASDQLQTRIHLSIGLVTTTLPRDEFCTESASDYFRMYGLTGDEAGEAYLETAKLALSFGFVPPEEFIIGPWCVARHPHAWTIGPDGEMYKCLSTVGRDDEVVGFLPNTPDDTDLRENSVQRMSSCMQEKCPILPLCGGGCLYEEKVSAERACARELLTTINKGLMLLHH